MELIIDFDKIKDPPCPFKRPRLNASECERPRSPNLLTK
jgi:hypothetical protein